MRLEVSPNAFLFVIILRSLQQLPEVLGGRGSFSPFGRWERRGPERSSSLLKVTQRVSVTAWVRTQVSLRPGCGLGCCSIGHAHTYLPTCTQVLTPLMHTHERKAYTCTHTLYLRRLSWAAARPWTSVSPRGRGGPLRGKKRKGSGYLEGRMDGALSLPEGGVRGTYWRPPG